MAVSIRPTLKNMPRRQARFCLAIERICREKFAIQPGTGILLAVSGGADSIALAVVFGALAPRLDLRLAAVHINHCIRGEAASDANFCVDFCAFLGIGCTIFEMDAVALAKQRKCGLEEAGRMGRYSIFEEERQRLHSDFIALGHHNGDLGEDILMRLSRGTGWPGLGGMADMDDKRKLIRPFLTFSPARLREFLLALGLPWREDSSNACGEFKRNRIRNSIMPLLRAENPKLETAINNIHHLAELDGQYWEGILDLALRKNPWRIKKNRAGASLELPELLLGSLVSASRLRLYHKALGHIYKICGICGQARAETLFKLDDAWIKRHGNAVFQFSGKVYAQVLGRDIMFVVPEIR